MGFVGTTVIIEKGLDIGTFTLKELYDEIYTEYQLKYPNNKPVDASIRRNLQGLRRDGFLRFINNQGGYEVISKENEAWAIFVKKYHTCS